MTFDVITYTGDCFQAVGLHQMCRHNWKHSKLTYYDDITVKASWYYVAMICLRIINNYYVLVGISIQMYKNNLKIMSLKKGSRDRPLP